MNAHSFIYWWRLHGAWTGCRVPYNDAWTNSMFYVSFTLDLCQIFITRNS